MAFRLKLREPLPEGLKRVFCEQIDSALHCAKTPPNNVASLCTKFAQASQKLPCAMRLAIGAVGKNCHARGEIVACARSDDWSPTCATRRCDCKRLFNCAISSGEKFRTTALSAHGGIVAARTRKFFRSISPVGKAEAIPQLENVKARLMAWPAGRSELETDLRRSMQNLQARPARTCQQRLMIRTPENFHAWRKRVKDVVVSAANFAATGTERFWKRWLMMRRCWANCWGASTISIFFGRVLERESGDEALADELAQLQKLIGKRCKRLRRDALELGRRFYAEPSKAFAKRISIFAGKRRRKTAVMPICATIRDRHASRIFDS